MKLRFTTYALLALLLIGVLVFLLVIRARDHIVNNAWRDVEPARVADRYQKDPLRPLTVFDIDSDFERSQTYENHFFGIRFTFPVEWNADEVLSPSNNRGYIAVSRSSGSLAWPNAAVIISVRPPERVGYRPPNGYPLLLWEGRFATTKPYDAEKIFGTFMENNNNIVPKFHFWVYKNAYAFDVEVLQSEMTREKFLAFVYGLEFFTPTEPLAAEKLRIIRDPICGYSLSHTEGWYYSKYGACTFNADGADDIGSSEGQITVTDRFENYWNAQYSLIEEIIIDGVPSEIYEVKTKQDGLMTYTDYAVLIKRDDKPLLFKVQGNTEKDNIKLIEYVKKIEMP